MINRRSLVGAFTKVAAIIPGISIHEAAATQSSGRRLIQMKVDEVASLADMLEINDFDDVAFAAQLAFDNANTRDGRGATFRIPPRVLVMKAPLVVPDRIMLVGSGVRDTIFHAQHDGPMFVFEDVEHCGLSNVRLGLGKRPMTEGIRIEARQRSVRRLSFANIEIAGGGREGSGKGADGGQIGVSIAAHDQQIVSECTFDRFIFSEIERPVVERGPEGNEWTRFVIDQFSYRGGFGFDSVGHANHYQGRIAGSPGAGTVAFRQHGYRNILLLRVDIGNSAQALDLGPNSRNIAIVQRPSQDQPNVVQTPIGQVAGNTIIDGDQGTGPGA